VSIEVVVTGGEEEDDSGRLFVVLVCLCVKKLKEIDKKTGRRITLFSKKRHEIL
jgi:hypothetical protein